MAATSTDDARVGMTSAWGIRWRITPLADAYRYIEERSAEIDAMPNPPMVEPFGVVRVPGAYSGLHGRGGGRRGVPACT